MTAEIAIINPTAIALAADSVVSVGNSKEYQSVNKLFRLSVNAPVGIMVYGDATFMGVPWELFIKEYRAARKESKPFDTLHEYAIDFLKFIASEQRVFGPGEQDELLEDEISSYFAYMLNSIKEEVEEHINTHGAIPDDEVDKILAKKIRNSARVLKSLPLLKTTKRGIATRVDVVAERVIDQAINRVFPQGLPKGIGRSSMLGIAKNVLCKDCRDTSGLVIAGFGQQEMYPHICEVNPQVLLKGILGYAETAFSGPDRQGATIIPFAQRQTVDAFLGGMDSELTGIITQSLKGVFDEFSESVVQEFCKCAPPVSEDRKIAIAKVCKKHSDRLTNGFQKALMEVRYKRYANPILAAVRVLPKDELASMAESLVNLTSLRQRVSLTRETVGGPIDVAIISRGEGFVWIKRKHYFPEELNRRFYK